MSVLSLFDGMSCGQIGVFITHCIRLVKKTDK